MLSLPASDPTGLPKRSELRRDPISGRWVIIATERANRPLELTEQAVHLPRGECPFCGGNEAETPQAVACWPETTVGVANPNWQVRVVPNKFPALRGHGETDFQRHGIYDQMNGIGVHEVIIESREHVASLTGVALENVLVTLRMYRERLRYWKQDARLVYGMIFKNVGSQAGASLAHTHSQLIVLPIVPINVRDEMQGSLIHYETAGACIFCSMIEQECRDAERVLHISEDFLAFCPFASRFPYEAWIVPRRHESHFEDLPDREIQSLADVLRLVLGQVETSLCRPAYNFILHTAPFDSPFLPYYHWHLEIIPRLTRIAGFEWGTGFYINPMPPEKAAGCLRQQAGSVQP